MTHENPGGNRAAQPHGVLRRHLNLKIILPHAGGFLPYAADRLAAAALLMPDTTPEQVRTDLRRFYFDTAVSTASALPSLLAFARPDHVLYGSDLPYNPPEWLVRFDTALDTYPHLDDSQHAAIDRHNAEALFPRLGSGTAHAATALPKAHGSY